MGNDVGPLNVKKEGLPLRDELMAVKMERQSTPLKRSTIKAEASEDDEGSDSDGDGSSLASPSSSTSSRSPYHDGTPLDNSDAGSSSHSIASSTMARIPSPSSPRKRHAGMTNGYDGLTPVVTSLPSTRRTKKTTKSQSTAGAAPPQIIDHLPRAEEEALSTFTVLTENSYANKHIGRSQGHDWGLVCECNYRPGRDDLSSACSEEANCINRLTQVECLAKDCRCGTHCQNQRFQKKQYSDVQVIQTEKKGFGLRAGSDIPAEAFIYEYIGEVVEESDFQKRMRRYHDERIPHFYFMMLQRDEYLDATKRGGIARFINHSCNPNCYVAKWHVGKHYRMGIFSQRDILKGEELTFNYNVDRYGNEAQPCYCGEPNCVGQLGGKTQTDIGGMSNLYIEALGIVDVVEQLQARGNKKQKSRILDEDFTPTLHPLEEDEVPTVATAIRQASSNRSILTKLLQRIEMTDDLAVHKRFVRLHGFVLMSGVLTGWKDDAEVLVSCMRILAKWPLIARNKVIDTGVDAIVASLCQTEGQEEVATLAKELYEAWQRLTVEFRIARKEEAGGEGGGAEHESEGQDPNEVARTNRRRREYEEDSHDDIQSRMDHELDRAQAPNDVSDRLRAAVPKPLGVLPTAGMVPGAHRFRGGWAGGSPWRPPPSSRVMSTPLSSHGGYKNASLATPSTPQTPDERSTLLSGTTTATPPSSTGAPSAPTNTRTMSIEEIIRRANEAQALERSKMEEMGEEERQRAKRLAAAKGKENGTSSGSSHNKGKHRSTNGGGGEDLSTSSSKRRKKHHRSSHTNGTSNGNRPTSRPPPQTQSELEQQVEKRLRSIVGETVVKVMSKYKDRLDKETFKKHAKELTNLICAKEKKNPKFWPPVLSKDHSQAQSEDAGGKEGEGVVDQGERGASNNGTTNNNGVAVASHKDRQKTPSQTATDLYLIKLSSSGEKKDKMKSFAKEYTLKLVARKGTGSNSNGGGGGGDGGGGSSIASGSGSGLGSKSGGRGGTDADADADAEVKKIDSTSTPHPIDTPSLSTTPGGNV